MLGGEGVTCLGMKRVGLCGKLSCEGPGEPGMGKASPSLSPWLLASSSHPQGYNPPSSIQQLLSQKARSSTCPLPARPEPKLAQRFAPSLLCSTQSLLSALVWGRGRNKILSFKDPKNPGCLPVTHLPLFLLSACSWEWGAALAERREGGLGVCVMMVSKVNTMQDQPGYQQGHRPKATGSTGKWGNHSPHRFKASPCK
jgi:hypothetical protein